MPGLPSIGVPELIIILVIALLVIGPGKLPEVGSAFGKTIKEFRKASTDLQETAGVATAPMKEAAASVTAAAAQPVAPAAPTTAPPETAAHVAPPPAGTPVDAIDQRA